MFVGECVRVCVLLKLTCKSVLFRYPEINSKQNSKHFKLNQQKICVRVWKTTFCKFHTRKKNECHVFSSYFCFIFNVFFFVKCHSQLYLQPISAKECSLNCWNSVFVCFSSNNAWGTQQRKLISGGWGWLGVLNIYTMRILQTHRAVLGGEAAFLLFQFQLFFALAFQWVFCFLLLMEHTFCLIFFCFCYTRDKSEFIFVRFFLECGFYFLLFFCNFLGRDEPFNVFNCCNDLLHQVIL